MATAVSPRRVHDLELFVEALVCLAKDCSTEEEVASRLRRKARQMRLRSTGMGVFTIEDDSKSLALGTVREVIKELARFDLLKSAAASSLGLSEEGHELAELFTRRRTHQRGLNRLSELHLQRFPLLRALLDALGRAHEGVFVVPRPSPRNLGLAIAERTLSAYETFMEEAARYAAGELRQWGVGGVRAPSVLASVRREAGAKDRLYRRRSSSWSHRIMVDTIHDAISRAALAFLVPGLGVIDFEIFCSRASTLGLLNYTDHLDGVQGRIVYATSWRANAVPTWIRPANLHQLDAGFDDPYRLHSPAWARIRPRFNIALWETYEQLRVHKRSLAPPVADVRDAVCFRLRISDATFNHFLTNLYHETMRSDIGIGISLEADEVKEVRGAQTTKRDPLYLSNAAPRTVIRVYRRG